MKNQCTLFYTDNEALVHVINNHTCKDKSLMIFVRQLVLICLEHNKFSLLLNNRYVNGKKLSPKTIFDNCLMFF